jgi:hypothetical protein
MRMREFFLCVSSNPVTMGLWDIKVEYTSEYTRVKSPERSALMSAQGGVS